MSMWPESLPVPDSVADFLQAVGRPTRYFDLELDQCALLVIDMQNDFILPGAPLEGWNCMAIVPKIAELVLFFRAYNRPVIWTKHIHQLNDIGILASDVAGHRPGFADQGIGQRYSGGGDHV
jgi:nicotinamidase-related amidase